MWNEALNVANIVVVARMVCLGALARDESRGAHYRSDRPERDDETWLRNVILSPAAAGGVEVSTTPVAFPFLSPSADDVPERD